VSISESVQEKGEGCSFSGSLVFFSLELWRQRKDCLFKSKGTEQTEKGENKYELAGDWEGWRSFVYVCDEPKDIEEKKEKSDQAEAGNREQLGGGWAGLRARQAGEEPRYPRKMV